jgi:hypothetical protein
MIDRERVVREVREAADMDHPWIPGARADLIRDAADLLEAPPDLAGMTEADLDTAQEALTQERVIRKVMRDTGEPRDIVVDMIEAMKSMADEAVLDLMEGEPTSLRAALQRYVDELEKRDELQPRDRVVDDLSVLLNYRFRIASGGPGQELTYRWPGVDLEVVVGDQVVETVYRSDERSLFILAEDVATAVHRALVK